MTITQLFKNAAINGCINIDKALSIANELDNQREQSKTILKECERNVGMYLGEKINAHLAEMDGSRFNAVDYHFERFPGEQ
jgi:dsDNA-binding SOS-regulon protein